MITINAANKPFTMGILTEALDAMVAPHTIRLPPSLHDLVYRSGLVRWPERPHALVEGRYAIEVAPPILIPLRAVSDPSLPADTVRVYNADRELVGEIQHLRVG